MIKMKFIKSSIVYRCKWSMVSNGCKERLSEIEIENMKLFRSVMCLVFFFLNLGLNPTFTLFS